MNGALGTIQSEALDCEHKPKALDRFPCDRQKICEANLLPHKIHGVNLMHTPTLGPIPERSIRSSRILCDWREEDLQEGYFGTTSKEPAGSLRGGA